MDQSADHHRRTANTLRERIRLSLALDDAMASELDHAAHALGASGDGEGARALVEAARKHRVGAIKHRAILSARGLDV